MTILVVSPTPTHPTTAGNRARILSLTDLLRSVLADPALADRLAAGGRRMAEAWHARQVESLRAALRGSGRPA